VNDTAPDKASATVRFKNFKMPTTVLYDLVKLGNGWRIANITWPGNDSASHLARSLRQEVSALAALSVAASLVPTGPSDDSPVSSSA
jgi:hypothetical protein